MISNLFSVALAALSLSACNGMGAETMDAGPQESRAVPIAAFHAVEVGGAYRVTVREGGSPSLEAKGGSNALARMKVEIKDGVLRIGEDRDRKVRWTNDGTVTVVVTGGQAIDKASVAGSGNLDVKSASGANFSGSVAGSGDLRVADLKAGGVKLSVAGSGTIHASGTGSDGNYSIAGSGDIEAAALKLRDAKVSIAGSGNVAGHASGAAKVNIAGSGDVRIEGGATCTTSKAGSGNVVCS